MEHSHYKEYQDLRGDGRIILYQRKDTKKPTWWCRIKIPGSKGYKIVSTKSQDYRTSVRFSEDLYYEIEGKIRRGESITEHKFDKVVDEWLKYNDYQLRERSNQYKEIFHHKVRKFLKPYFTGQNISTIDQKSIEGYFLKRSKHLHHGREPSSSSLRFEVVLLRKFFRYCLSQGYVRDLPEISSPGSKKVDRPDFTRKEWNQLVQYLRHYPDKGMGGVHPRIHRQRVYLRHFIYILGNTGIRPGTESRNLKWRDVGSVFDEEGNEVVSLDVKGKTNHRKVISQPGVERHLEELKKFRTLELGEEPKRDEPIFCNKDGSPTGSFRKGMEHLLNEYDLLRDSYGIKRVPYSLRHTYINLQLDNGVDSYILSKNVGSSVEMIEKFYGKNRSNPERVSQITSGKRKRMKKYGDD